MSSVYALMAVPVLAALVSWHVVRKTQGAWILGVACAGVGAMLIAITFAVSYGTAISDVEIWNGKIIDKQRLHGTYERAYQCNCTTDSNGSSSCQTCYETRYTVNWEAKSTIGTFTIDSLDRGSRRVYSTPDPQRYTIIQNGDPVARAMPYANYVQAVPNSLFAPAPKELHARFAQLLAPYPINIYDFYRVNRFVTPGFNFADAPQWNADIAEMLKDIGPLKQVNAIVVVAKTTDTDYEFALRDHWEGVNKNDVVLLIGSENGQDIAFVSVISWTSNEIFKIELADAVRDMGTIDREKIISAMKNQITKNFERRRMREFNYLKGEINPPEWLIATTIVLILLGNVGAVWFFKHQNRPYTPRRWR